MSRRRRGRAPAAAAPPPRVFPWPWAVFAAALAARLLYWRATPDAAWPHSAGFKGDALLWLEYARAIVTGAPFELGLPIHPPGAAGLLAVLWGGEGGFALAKAAWCVMGAAAAGLFTSAATRAFGILPGACAGVVMAASTSLLVLTTSLNGETPYLLLVAAAFAVLPGADAAPGPPRLLAWGALSGAACLFRVEHALFVALVAAFLAARATRARGIAAAAAALAVAGVGFVAPLLPWQLHAWRAVARFNTEVPAPAPPVRALLDALRGLPWDPEARARLDAVPAFTRDHTEAFVAATVAHRGGARVRATDFAVVEEAFGSAPRPLAARPFVSLYGPLNFALASHPGAGPGFGHVALDQPPPLAGGASAYPAMLVGGLPPRDLAFTYPPHLALVNDGYAMGLRWLAADPKRAARRAAERLGHAWSGAATALTGYGLPAGLSGTRAAVDIVVADGWAAALWRIAVLFAGAAGLAAGRRTPALFPWLAFLAVKALAAALFFGYARLGASAVPVVAVLLGLAAARWIARPGTERGLRLALVALLAVEAVRFLHGPGLALDGDAAGPRHDPVAASDHESHHLRVVP
jgi:hypothetical protein